MQSLDLLFGMLSNIRTVSGRRIERDQKDFKGNGGPPNSAVAAPAVARGRGNLCKKHELPAHATVQKTKVFCTPPVQSSAAAPVVPPGSLKVWLSNTGRRFTTNAGGLLNSPQRPSQSPQRDDLLFFLRSRRYLHRRGYWPSGRNSRANRFARKRFPIELYSAARPVWGGTTSGIRRGIDGQAHNTISGIF